MARTGEPGGTWYTLGTMAKNDAERKQQNNTGTWAKLGLLAKSPKPTENPVSTQPAFPPVSPNPFPVQPPMAATPNPRPLPRPGSTIGNTNYAYPMDYLAPVRR